MGNIIYTGETEPIRVQLTDFNGAGLTGATISLEIIRSADGYFWNGATFGAGASNVTMEETDSADLPGIYHYNFDTTGQDLGRYLARATTSTTGAAQTLWVEDLVIDDEPVGGTESVSLFGERLDVELEQNKLAVEVSPNSIEVEVTQPTEIIEIDADILSTSVDDIIKEVEK